MKDDHCYFVTIDFDKEHWQKDILFFANICNEYDVPHLVERSQSDNCGHVWIFFKEAIPAITARNLATALLTLTMQLRPTLSMDSYDRLFPNQDILPKGGFGNLIALPLQGKRRTQGNSTFIQVNDDFLPYADPWQVLQDINQLKLLEIEELLKKIQKITGILDVNTASSENKDSQPWERKPSSDKCYPDITETLPKNLAIKMHTNFEKCPQLDYLMVLGGQSTRNKANNQQLLTFIQEQYKSCKQILSVCTGIFLSHKVGILNREKVKTHWVSVDKNTL